MMQNHVSKLIDSKSLPLRFYGSMPRMCFAEYLFFIITKVLNCTIKIKVESGLIQGITLPIENKQ